MAFDITTAGVSDTAVIELNDANGAPLYGENDERCGIKMYGPGSKTWNRANAERNRRRSVRIQKNRKAAADVDAMEEEELDFLVTITIEFVNWSFPNPEAKDGKWGVKADEFRAAYDHDPIGFIREQAQAEGNSWGAFTKS